MSYVWQRFIHFVIAVIFLTIGMGLTVFVYSNTTSVNIDWWQFHYTNVPLGMVALVPLLLGVVLGYLYHVPSGIHDFTQSVRKSHRISELEREKQDLQHQVDRLLAMPGDTTAAKPVAAAVPAPAAAPVVDAAASHSAAGQEPRPVAKTRAVHEVKLEHGPAHEAKPHPRPHGPDNPTQREPAPSG